jgi:hypothetical protein
METPRKRIIGNACGAQVPSAGAQPGKHGVAFIRCLYAESDGYAAQSYCYRANWKEFSGQVDITSGLKPTCAAPPVHIAHAQPRAPLHEKS